MTRHHHIEVTPHEVAMSLIRQRGTCTGEPEFIVAYLRAEQARDPRLGLTPNRALLYDVSAFHDALVASLASLHDFAGAAARALAQVGVLQPGDHVLVA